ncbi:MAG: hypothetical protein ACOC16_04085 [Nanoarchaeota archaeon]
MNSHIINWKDKIRLKEYRGHPKISLKLEDYHIIGIDPNTLNNIQKRQLNFIDGFIEYLFVLKAPKKNKILNSATIGFNLENKLINCKQIQGCKGRYRELTPIIWQRSLLNSLKKFGYKNGFTQLSVPSYIKVKGAEWFNMDTLKKHYDYNAQSLNFKYNQTKQSWIFEF